MSIFANPFFSWAGQAERIGNVFSTVKSSVTLQGVKSNTGNKVVDAALSAVASNPYSTAAVIAFPTQIGSTVGKVVGGLSTGVKVVGGASTLIAAPIIASSPTLLAGTIKGVSYLTPESLVKTGLAVSKATKEPTKENIFTALKTNPVVDAAVVAASLYYGGKAYVGWQNIQNTKELSENNKLMKKSNDIMADPPAPLASPFVPPIVPPQNSPTSNHDVKIAEINAKALKEQNETQLKLARIQADAISKQEQPVAATSPPAATVVTPTKTLTTKKKAVKKKKKAPAKQKVYKRKKKKR